MERRIIVLILCLLTVWEVNLMSLKGPVLTRYDPCGLGLLHFDRLTENYWQAVVHFSLYTNINEVEIEVGFQRDTNIFAHPNSSSVTIKKLYNHTITVTAVKPLPDMYKFYTSFKNFTKHESDVPVVSLIKMNGVTLCDEQIKAAQTIISLNITKQFSGRSHVTAHVCGRRSLVNEELVSVRTEARPGDWPWHVAIFVRDNNDVLRYQCGGNIVSSTAIVTAGHCVYVQGATLKANQIAIVAGSISHTDMTHVGRQALEAVEVVLHPAYDDAYSTADLAIIRVNRLIFTEYVQPICIWGPVYEKTDLFGKEAIVVGFGSTEYNKQSNMLRSANTLIQNDTTCITFSSKVYTKLLDEFTFCAGYGPTSSINPRNGDSGGGLVIPKIQADHKISWQLRGVLSKCGVSPGHKTCDPRYYVVYTDVAPHYGWIFHHAGLEYRSNILT